jgi:lipopolysaccharide export system permease protein
MRLLDRYVLGSWLRLFALTVLGFPLISIVINLTDQLNKLLDRGLTPGRIALSYLYSIPENVFLIIPAAVLFATVFTVGAMSRHAEITAAKASGQSFYRLILPIVAAGALVAPLAFLVGELAVGTTARMNDIQKARQAQSLLGRVNFVYRAEAGWVYAVRTLDVDRRRLEGLLLERQGQGPDYPSLVISADSATWSDSLRAWRLWNGTSRVVAGPRRQATLRFRTLRLAAMRESPADLVAEPKAPEEMRYAELGRYITTLERSGNDASKLEVDRALKIALPVTCLVIVLFGAPLAMSSPRSGAAMGIAISLGTTVAYLLLAQIARAVGAGGVIDPTFAAWVPNIVFFLAALFLLGRVRT